MAFEDRFAQHGEARLYCVREEAAGGARLCVWVFYRYGVLQGLRHPPVEELVDHLRFHNYAFKDELEVVGWRFN